MALIQNPAVDAGHIQCPVENPAIPLDTFVVNTVNCREHVEQVHSSHVRVIFRDGSGTLDFHKFLILIVPSFQCLDGMDGDMGG